MNRADRLLSTGLATAWLLLLAFAALVLVRPWPDIVLRIDFSSFWMAASLLRDGSGPTMFDPSAQHAFELNLRRSLAQTDLVRYETGFNPYPNLPVLALPYLPLTYLPVSVGYLVWWAVSLASFVAAVVLPLRGHRFGRSIAVLALSFTPVTTTLFEGQPYGFFLLALVLALMAFRTDRPFVGGLLLGFFWLKPQYALVFPVLFVVKRRWAELAGMIVTGIAIGLSSLLLVGVDGMLAYVRLLGQIGGFSYQWVDPFAMVNWRAILINLWPGASDPIGQLGVAVLGGATMLISFLAWRGPWDPSSPLFPRQLLVLLLALLVASPHSHLHGAVTLLGPLMLYGRNPSQSFALSPAEKGLLGAGYILALAVWPGGLPRWILAPFFIFSMAVLLWRCPQFSSKEPREEVAVVTV